MLVYMRDSAAPGRDVSEGKAALGLSVYGSVPRGVYGSVGDLSIPVKRTPKPPPPKKRMRPEVSLGRCLIWVEFDPFSCPHMTWPCQE